MALVLIPLPSHDFDPTEVAVPWRVLTGRGHRVRFATPDGAIGVADPRMVRGDGLGPWRPLLRADRRGREAYAALQQDPSFRSPGDYRDALAQPFDGLVLPGGHAPGMRHYLESELLQAAVAAAFDRGLPVGAICHGVVLVARSKRGDGRSVLFGRRTTALTRSLELAGWLLTPWLGRYYRTYPQTVQAEVTAALASPHDFVAGPPAVLRDNLQNLGRGFTVRDGPYLSARWPGDAHRFAIDFAAMIESRPA
jgi:putative intracellular protease/amidase